ncbi:MAG TPA: XRE family transcriptional regulator [Ruminococcaceae bacterium]|nr:XRE family transcriptional regulator [Oscillospiraceae bacterium]
MKIEFGDKLKQQRLTKQVTQKQIAEYLEVTPVTVQRFEYGIRRPSLDNIAKLCEYFNISADYLLGLSDDSERH